MNFWQDDLLLWKVEIFLILLIVAEFLYQHGKKKKENAKKIEAGNKETPAV
jgi:hypothetical protein